MSQDSNTSESEKSTANWLQSAWNLAGKAISNTAYDLAELTAQLNGNEELRKSLGKQRAYDFERNSTNVWLAAYKKGQQDLKTTTSLVNSAYEKGREDLQTTTSLINSAYEKGQQDLQTTTSFVEEAYKKGQQDLQTTTAFVEEAYKKGQEGLKTTTTLMDTANKKTMEAVYNFSLAAQAKVEEQIGPYDNWQDLEKKVGEKIAKYVQDQGLTPELEGLENLVRNPGKELENLAQTAGEMTAELTADIKDWTQMRWGELQERVQGVLPQAEAKSRADDPTAWDEIAQEPTDEELAAMWEQHQGREG